jgi:hypothetical protein
LNKFNVVLKAYTSIGSWPKPTAKQNFISKKALLSLETGHQNAFVQAL